MKFRNIAGRGIFGESKVKGKLPMTGKYMAYVGSYSYTGKAKGITVYDVDVEAGKTETVKLKVAVNDLYIVNAGNKRVVEPGEFELQVGAASDNILQSKVVSVGEFVSTALVEEQKILKSSKTISVHGEVRDVQATLIGKVNIYAKSTGELLGKSDDRGCYRMDVGNKEVLIFSKKGYQNLEVPVDNQEVVNVRMNYGDN